MPKPDALLIVLPLALAQTFCSVSQEFSLSTALMSTPSVHLIPCAHKTMLWSVQVDVSAL